MRLILVILWISLAVCESTGQTPDELKMNRNQGQTVHVGIKCSVLMYPGLYSPVYLYSDILKVYPLQRDLWEHDSTSPVKVTFIAC